MRYQNIMIGNKSQDRMEAQKKNTRKHLCMPGLLNRARHSFDKIKDGISRKVSISLPDCLMSGLAVFSLKYPSLLQFDKDRNTEIQVKQKPRIVSK